MESGDIIYLPMILKLVRNIPPHGARIYALKMEQRALEMKKTFLSRYSDPTTAATFLEEIKRKRREGWSPSTHDSLV